MDLIQGVTEVNIIKEQEYTQIVLFMKEKGAIRGILEPTLKLNQFKLQGNNEVFVQELITEKGREHIKKLYQLSPGKALEANPGHLL